MEVTIEGVNYRTGRLDAFKQLHVARRLAPLLAAMGSVAAKTDLEKIENLADLPGALMPLVQTLSELKDEDCDYVLKACLAVCERQVDGQATWSKVMTNGQLMYQTGPGAIGLKEMMRLAAAVIQENLGSFFPVDQPGGSPSA